MVHFTDVETSERRQKFETVKHEIDTALRYPGVQEELGSLGATLLTLNEEAFLPNVNHGQVFIPRKYHNTDATALLLRLSSDGTLYPADSVAQPSPDRWKKVRRALKLKGGEPEDFMQQWMDVVRQRDTKEPLLHPEAAQSGALSYFDPNLDILMTGRMMVTMEYDKLPDHPVIRGEIGAHELAHVHDLQNLETRPNFDYAVYTELRGYTAGGIIIKAAIDAGAVGEDEAWDFDQSTAIVEDIIEQNQIDSAALLAGVIKHDEHFKDVRYEMFINNIVRIVI